jgi:hypothetical protein
VKKTGGNDVKRWVEPLLGLVQFGVGRVVIGLLEGLLVGPDEIPMRKRIRAVLKNLKAAKVGTPLVPISMGRSSGFRRLRGGLKGYGPGWPFKSKKASASGPSMKASEVRRPSSPPLYSVPAGEVCMGSGVGVEAFVAGEGFCTDDGAVGVDSVLVTGFTPPETGVVHSSDFGMPVVNNGEDSSTTPFVPTSPAISPFIPEWIVNAEVVSGSPEVSVAGLESLGFGDPGESSGQGSGSVPIPVEWAGEEKTLALVSQLVEQDPGSMTSVESPTVASRSLGSGLPTSSSVSPAVSASVEDGLEKAMGCCFGDGIPTHGCVGGLSSEGLVLSSEAILSQETSPANLLRDISVK